VTEQARATPRAVCIMPRNAARFAHEPMPPLGLMSIAAALEGLGVRVSLYDGQVEPLSHLDSLLADPTHLALIGGTTQQRFESFALARRARARCPQATVIYGGPHATFAAEDSLEGEAAIDIVCRGEGERTAGHLVSAIIAGENLSSVRGISWRSDGRVVHNADADLIPDVDEIAPPARHLADMARYLGVRDAYGRRIAHVMSARGCPYECTFCSASVMWRRRYRARCPALVVEEIAQLVKRYRVEHVKVFDSTFTVDRTHVEAFIEALRCAGLDLSWECEIRADTVDRPLLSAMRAAGCTDVQFGIESASERVLKTMRKGITLGQAENAIRWAHELGIRSHTFFTFGHPTEAWEDACETMRFLRAHVRFIADPVAGTGIVVYPGTEVHRFAVENRLLPEGFRWTAPYWEARNPSLGCDPFVPILIQPQMGWRELGAIRRRLLWLRVTTPHVCAYRLRRLRGVRDARAALRSVLCVWRPP